MITIQTQAALERIQEALVGKTDDDLKTLIENLDSLLDRAKTIQEVSACLISGDC